MPNEAIDNFFILKNSLVSELIMAFPRADHQHALIIDTATVTADTAGGHGIILTQKDEYNNFYAISYASHQLKDHEKNYSHFLLESAATVWVMNIFKEYLKGKQFILFTDHKPLGKIGHLHFKTMNRLKAAFLEHNFVSQYKKRGQNLSAMPTEETFHSQNTFTTTAANSRPAKHSDPH